MSGDLRRSLISVCSYEKKIHNNLNISEREFNNGVTIWGREFNNGFERENWEKYQAVRQDLNKV